MVDIDEYTMNRMNNEDIRSALRMCRAFPGDESCRRRLRKFLELRRLYRSDEPIKVWLVDFGTEKVYFKDESFREYEVEDEPLSYEVGTMAGRAFGNLSVSDY